MHDNFTHNSWTTLYDVNPLPLEQKYLVSLYWAFTTLTTVGYGDIVPHTVMERLFAMFLILAGAVTFGAYVHARIHSKPGGVDGVNVVVRVRAPPCLICPQNRGQDIVLVSQHEPS